MNLKFFKRSFIFFLCFVLFVAFFSVSKMVTFAQTTGTGDGTYDFGTLGVADSGGSGFKTQGDKFVVSNIFSSGGATLYLTNANSGSIVIKANDTTMKTFSISDLAIGMYASSVNVTQFDITLKDYNGNVLGTHTFSGSRNMNTDDFNISNFAFSTAWPSGGYDLVNTIEITYTLSYSTSNFEFRSITLSNISASLPAPAGSHTAEASANSLAPVVGVDNAITLRVKNTLGNTDTAYNGAKNVTITGVEAAPNGSYGSFNGTTLDVNSAGAGQVIPVTFTDGVGTANLKLNKADGQTLGFSLESVTTPATNTLTITPTHGAAATMAVTQDIIAPASNGSSFAQQPKVAVKDAFGNACTGDNTTVVTAAREDGGTWTLTGTTTATASAGVATFTDLGATNAALVNNAQLGFTATGLTKVTSMAVTLPAPAGSHTAEASANSLAPVVGVDNAITLRVKNTLGNTDTAYNGAK
ncbi:hypothetical protein ISU02_19665, partial [Fusibacter sp. Q10-2]|nr:hypothetical protein [Fusibacter ferrireducens]